MPKALTVPINDVSRNLALIRPFMEPSVHELLISLFNVDLSEWAKHDEEAFKAACKTTPPAVGELIAEAMKP